MVLLKSTTETLAITTSSTADIDYSVSYADITTTTFVPSTSEGKITTATTTTIVPAPAASTQRQVKLLTIVNRHASTSNTVRVVKYISGTDYVVTAAVALGPGESAQYTGGVGWVYYSTTGSIKGELEAAGSNTHIQVNDNGVLSGSAGLTYASNDLSIANTNSSLTIGGSGTSTPSAPASGNLRLFGRTIANRMMLAQVGSSGRDESFQSLLARNKIAYWNPPGNATTVPGVFGCTALTGQGTAAARNVATTSLATRMRRIGYPSSATAGSHAGVYLPVAQYSCGSGVANDGSGFMLIERWVESDPATVAGRRSFHGMRSSTTAFTNVQPNTLTNVVGICQLSTDATNWYWYSAGSVAQTAVQISAGAMGSPGGNSTTAWELAIFAPNGTANTYYLELTNLTTGAIISTTVSGGATVVPQSTTLLGWGAWACNNTTALSVGIDLCSLYIETDT